MTQATKTRKPSTKTLQELVEYVILKRQIAGTFDAYNRIVLSAKLYDIEESLKEQGLEI